MTDRRAIVAIFRNHVYTTIVGIIISPPARRESSHTLTKFQVCVWSCRAINIQIMYIQPNVYTRPKEKQKRNNAHLNFIFADLHIEEGRGR